MVRAQAFFLVAMLALSLSSVGWAQLVGGGEISYDAGSCLSAADVANIEAGIKDYEAKFSPLSRKLKGTFPKYSFYPMAGTLFGDVFINNFVDLDPGEGGIQTFDCTDWSNDGHAGHDVDLRSFAEQIIGVPIFAVADGTVVVTHDGEPDMNTETLGQPANFVTIDHGNGRIILYIHMRRESVDVSVGEVVKAGQQIGLVASSGNSTGPHLHLEIIDNGVIFEPNAGPCRAGESGWVNQVPLPTEAYIWDFGITDQSLEGFRFPDEAPRNVQITPADSLLRFWLIFGALPGNSTWRIQLFDSTGTIRNDFDGTFDIPTFHRSGNLRFDVGNPGTGSDLGTWRLVFWINGEVLVDAPYELVSSVSPTFNRPPGAVSVSFEPAAPNAGDVVVCRVDSSLVFDDPDYDLVSYNYTWRVNGMIVREVTNAATSDVLERDMASDGDELKCTVVPTDGKAEGPESFTAVVLGDGMNRPPILNPIGNREVAELEELRFVVTGSDPDGDGVTFAAFNLPTGAAFDGPTRTFSWTPGLGATAIYPDVLFTVTDDGVPMMTASEGITITVGDVNHPPVLDPIGNRSVPEGEELRFVVTGSDPDGDGLTFSASNLPPGAVFDGPARTFSWTPGFGDAGNFPDVMFTLTDDGDPVETDSESITITVGDVNHPPILDPIGNREAIEGEELRFVVTGSDPDGDGLTYSASNLPPGAVFDGPTQTFSWTPGFGDAGNFLDVLFVVTDDGARLEIDFESITITVGNVNRLPVLNPIGNRTVAEGEELRFVVTGSDPDGDGLTYSASNLPPGAVFDGPTHTFTWTPNFGDAGNFPDVLFTVTDNVVPVVIDSESITITVGDVNRPPVLNPIGNRDVTEGEELRFVVTGSDPDGDGLTYSASNLPPGAVFDGPTRTFTWTPGSEDGGNHPDVLFTLTDDGVPAESDSESITIAVTLISVAGCSSTGFGSSQSWSGDLFLILVTLVVLSILGRRHGGRLARRRAYTQGLY